MARRVASGLAGLVSRLHTRGSAVLLPGVTAVKPSSDREANDAERRSTPPAGTSKDDDTPIAWYRRRVQTGSLLGNDAAQVSALGELSALRERLARLFCATDGDSGGRRNTRTATKDDDAHQAALMSESSDGEVEKWGSDGDGGRQLKNHSQGVYLHGGVGRGKTMLMNAFLETLPFDIKRRTRRTHFHEFMAEIHTRLHKMSKFTTNVRLSNDEFGSSNYGSRRDGSTTNNTGGDTNTSDPLATVALQLFKESPVICFDEVELADVADALVFKRLFECFFSLGGFVVATSNCAPNDLYKGGINRNAFVSFVETLNSRLKVVSFDVRLIGGGGDGGNGTEENAKKDDESRFDYRRILKANEAKREDDENNLNAMDRKSQRRPSLAAGVASVILAHDNTQPSSGDEVNNKLHEMWIAATNEISGSTKIKKYAGDDSEPVSVPIASGRTLSAQKSRRNGLFISFHDLCGSEALLGAADYVVILQKYNALGITDVPRFNLQNENELRRFVNFVDVAYEAGALVIASVATEVDILFGSGGEEGDDDFMNFISSSQGTIRRRVQMEGTNGEFSVLGMGGSSGRSTPVVGNMEWSATGRSGASLADLQATNFTFKASARCRSRLVEMGSAGWERQWWEKRQTRKRSDSS